MIANTKTGMLVLLLVLCKCVSNTPFPWQTFFKASDISTEDMEYLKRYTLCNYKRGFLDKTCSCKSNCMYSHSCCIDYLWNPNVTETLSDYIRRFLNMSKQYKIQKCYPLVSNLGDTTSSAENILMVSKCPHIMENKESSRTCLKRDVSPVVSNKSVYKNKYCAICWNDTKFNNLQLKADCDQRKVIGNTTSENFFEYYKFCKIKVATDLVKPINIQECEYQSIPQCSSETQRCSLCDSYMAQISISHKCYRNIHCYSDNEIEQEQFWNVNFTFCYQNFPNHLTYNFGYGINFNLPKYSMLVTFQDNNLVASKKCPLNQNYDHISKSCLNKVLCRLGYTLIDNVCTLDKNLKNVPSVTNLTLSKPHDILQNCLGKQRYLLIQRDDMNEVDNNTNYYTSAEVLMKENFMETGIIYKNDSTILVKTDGPVPKNVSVMLNDLSVTLIKTSTNFHFTEFYKVDFARFFPNGKICAAPKKHSYNDIIIYPNCTIKIPATDLQTRDYIINERIKNWEAIVEVFTCIQFHLDKNCPLRQIDLYESSRNNVVEVESNKTLNVNEFIPLKRGIGVCTSVASSTLQKSSWEDLVSKIEGYLTIIGCVLSIIGYIWVILTYVLIKELRTVPGKNIVGLCLELLISDLIVLINMVPTRTPAFCTTFAVLLHFSNLSIQCWTLCIAFEIWSTFRNSSIKRKFKSSRRFYTYLTFASVLPMLFVLVCVVLNQVKKDAMVYGYIGICWVANNTARLLAYIIPTIFSVCATVTMLSYSIYKIYKQSKKSERLLKRSGGENVSLLKMTFKLIILFGIIEIFGFFQVGYQKEKTKIINAILRIIYCIFRSFRGVFIWLIYIVTDKVFEIYRAKRRQYSYKSSTRLSSVSKTQDKNLNHNKTSLLESAH